ncbi:serine hydrolase domain-containing protein [Pseudoteredinibacter isoporae]|uniref:Beta-lactamase-related domain-containing protein n=1 Tax=Pseudoteredinibacter isoporae TaxID=570281 RepID=A0A7X0JVI8_9GAMM|nr:serine hydrolase [Pseudoteredinibacter isoporae]MBB6522220.1 hypothetical protein [Pseudoteredinibacter isoporae]NHO87754.1 serine hydrolase [Pseudoteredinibacter isoporae]NIB23915.1 serine hydrolase [Pseudoteredinibacter isoporae]
MKKILVISGICISAVLLYFYQDLQTIRVLLAYEKAFSAEYIDESFRSFHHQYPSVEVKNSTSVYTLQRPEQEAKLPVSFDYEGETRNIDEWVQRSHTTGIAILKDGKLVYEKYYRGNDENSHAIIMSVSKSMASMLIGKALEEGHIESVNDPVTKYLPELTQSAYGDGVTIKQLLQMSSGVRWSEDLDDLDSDIVQSIVASLLGSLDDFAASMVREHTPGSYNRYASVNTQVLGMIIESATGDSYQDYFEKHLWSKLGAEKSAFIQVDSTGMPLVYSGVNIVLRDMVRFGQLYLEEGKNYQGEQIINSNWVHESIQVEEDHLKPGVNNPASDSGFGYGYQWWIPLYPDDDYTAIGIYGQFVYVNPKHNVVIAKTSTYPSYPIDGAYMDHESLLAFQQIARQLESSIPDDSPQNTSTPTALPQQAQAGN